MTSIPLHHDEQGISRLWTVGHSTRAIADLMALLGHHGIRTVGDVRAFPFSRRNPQFRQETLQQSLEASRIAYRHLPGLGGRRKSREDSINLGWRNTGFRGYADYMESRDFEEALEELMALALEAPTAIMCAEAVPWRCHRSLIADALVVRGWEVLDIIDMAPPKPHRLPAWAKVRDGRLSYPGNMA